MTQYVVAIDQGTTGSTVLVIDEALRIVGKANREFEQIYPYPGWVEHDPEAIWKSVLEALNIALLQSGIDTSAIAAIGVTNQRETTVVWDRQTGAPIRNAIVWQDRRTADICMEMKELGHQERVRELTGLVLDPYFSGSKLKWMFDDDPSLHQRAKNGEVAFGTIDSFLVWRLTGGAVHVTEPSNASRTLLFGLESLDFEDELLELFDVPRQCLPLVKSSSEVYGKTRGLSGLPDGIPIAGMAGDQQAALFGQACFSSGDAKCTFGTGSFILMNTGDRPVSSTHGMLTTVGWQLDRGQNESEVVYALEGSAFVAGAVVQWLRDGLGIIESADEIERLALSVPDTGGVVLMPALAGLGAPHWRPEARGTITGITRGTTRAHLARAALEGIALQHVDILKAMERDSLQKLTALKVDGGAAANDLLMQLQADVLNVDISRPKIVETTAMGAAFLAGLATGLWNSKSDIGAAWVEDRRFTPAGDRAQIDAMINRWNEAVKKA
jgi:glycerol kinase